MGHYIETGEAKGKAGAIIKEYNAVEIHAPPHDLSNIPPGKALICVAEQLYFDAAAYVYDAGELKEFTRPDDPRYKRWLLIDATKAQELTGYTP